MNSLPSKFRWHWKLSVGLLFLVGGPATAFALFYGAASALAFKPLSTEDWFLIKSLFAVGLTTAVLVILEFIFEAVRRARRTHSETDSIYSAAPLLLILLVGIPSLAAGSGLAVLFYSSFGPPIGVFLIFVSIGAFGLAAEINKRQKQR